VTFGVGKLPPTTEGCLIVIHLEMQINNER
jgi:hypothetical protein